MSTSLLRRSATGAEALLSDEMYRSPTLDRRVPSQGRVPAITMDATEPFFVQFGNEGGIVFEQEPAPWFMPLLNKICELGELPLNWDSYGARSIDLRTATFAVSILFEFLSESDPLPSVVPTSCGGIQLEWHEGGVDLEIEIQSPSSVDMSITDGERDEDLEQVDFQTIQENLNILRSRLQSADENA